MLDHITFRGDRLDAWMEARGISSAEVAEQTGLTYNFLYLLRLNKRPNVSAENVTKIALAVGVTTDYLCNASDDPLGRGAGRGRGQIDEDEVELLLLFRSLAYGRRQDIIAIAQTFAAYLEDALDVRQQRLLDQVEELFGTDVLRDFVTALMESLPDTFGPEGETPLDSRPGPVLGDHTQ